LIFAVFGFFEFASIVNFDILEGISTRLITFSCVIIDGLLFSSFDLDNELIKGLFSLKASVFLAVFE
jgi:hypothetical protein